MRNVQPSIFPAVVTPLLLLAASATSQPQNTHAGIGVAPGIEPAAGSAIDPNVGDRDPLAASLRWIDPGNAQHSFRARMTVMDYGAAWSPFQPATPITIDPATGLAHSQGFQYRAPGIRALIDRPDYLVDIGGELPGRNIQPVRDGAQLMVIPANTVFQLTPERPASHKPEQPPHENMLDTRVDRRLAFTPNPSPIQNPVVFSAGLGDDRSAGITIDVSKLRYPQLALPTSTPIGAPPALAAPVNRKVHRPTQAQASPAAQPAEGAAETQADTDADTEAEIEVNADAQAATGTRADADTDADTTTRADTDTDATTRADTDNQ